MARFLQMEPTHRYRSHVRRGGASSRRRTLMWLSVLLLPHLVIGTLNAAEPHARDARILLRTLQYVRNLQPMDAVPIAILYDPNQPASQQEAVALEALLQREDTRQAIQARLVPISALETQENISVLFLTRRLGAHFERIARFAGERGLLTVSMDRECAGSEGCVVAFETQAGIEIFINQKNMKRNRIDFDAAFMYTAKRL
ncbi:YfiR/HmsC family protein [Acanthopleuribacter pedis]|uniref:DUF4154 domain-containing protein n=1 Tax=Acanthopleuribacter pedis TaxID=442870 RepID=A0A8J7QAG7_9BACT|nr:YfiR/HmsC family protein [Acanthopleuribacter pedis]MBO1320832.1 DUF4154 domain-containing protein [Acanthopleuribacter pedis]